MNEKPEFNLEAEKKIEQMPTLVSGENLIKLFMSVDFKQKFAEAADITMQSGYESAFSVLRDLFNSDVMVCSKVTKGTADSVGIHDEIEDNKLLAEGFNSFRMIELHFHPPVSKDSFRDDLGEPICPSDGDLFLLISSKIMPLVTEQAGYLESPKVISSRSLFIIAQADDNGDSLLLCYQEKPGANVSEEHLELLVKKLEFAANQQDILRLLRQYGFKAELIKISQKGNMSSKSKNLLASFAFQPQIIDRPRRKK
jgi:hypothetical protein